MVHSLLVSDLIPEVLIVILKIKLVLVAHLR